MTDETLDPRVIAARRNVERANRQDLLNDSHEYPSVNDLVGSNGEPLSPLEEDFAFCIVDPAHEDYLPPARQDWQDSEVDLFLSDDYFNDNHHTFPELAAERYQAGCQRILGALASRDSNELIEPLKQAVSRLRQPIRVVAIDYFYKGYDHMTTARRLGTSVETVEFLLQLALDEAERALSRPDHV